MQPIRVALFAPGSRERVMTKAMESGTDAVILDLEDSVPLASKADAEPYPLDALPGTVRAAVEEVLGVTKAPSRSGGPVCIGRAVAGYPGPCRREAGRSVLQ